MSPYWKSYVVSPVLWKKILDYNCIELAFVQLTSYSKWSKENNKVTYLFLLYCKVLFFRLTLIPILVYFIFTRITLWLSRTVPWYVVYKWRTYQYQECYFIRLLCLLVIRRLELMLRGELFLLRSVKSTAMETVLMDKLAIMWPRFEFKQA
jgi:hypothetical protein